MRNILIIGWDQVLGNQIIDCLVTLLPEDMEVFSYKVYPTAPDRCIRKDPAPYIEIMDDDIERARRIKDAIHHDIDSVDGHPDVQIIEIEFHEGNGEIEEDDNR